MIFEIFSTIIVFWYFKLFLVSLAFNIFVIVFSFSASPVSCLYCLLFFATIFSWLFVPFCVWLTKTPINVFYWKSIFKTGFATHLSTVPNVKVWVLHQRWVYTHTFLSQKYHYVFRTLHNDLDFGQLVRCFEEIIQGIPVNRLC